MKVSARLKEEAPEVAAYLEQVATWIETGTFTPLSWDPITFYAALQVATGLIGKDDEAVFRVVGAHSVMEIGKPNLAAGFLAPYLKDEARISICETAIASLSEIPRSLVYTQAARIAGQEDLERGLELADEGKVQMLNLHRVSAQGLEQSVQQVLAAAFNALVRVRLLSRASILPNLPKCEKKRQNALGLLEEVTGLLEYAVTSDAAKSTNTTSLFSIFFADALAYQSIQLWKRGKQEKAEVFIGQALFAVSGCSYDLLQARLLYFSSLIKSTMREYDWTEALEDARQARGIFALAGHPWKTRALVLIAQIYTRRGELAEAGRVLEEAEAELDKSKPLNLEALAASLSEMAELIPDEVLAAMAEEGDLFGDEPLTRDGLRELAAKLREGQCK